VTHVSRRLKVSQRRACRVLSQPRSTQRYLAQRRSGEVELAKRMRELALRHPRYGYRRVAALLRADGWRVNRKRVQRLWRIEGLKVPQKQRKTRRLHDGSSDNAAHRRRAERINHVWSFDFCHDRTADGRPLKIFSVIDEYTRRCLAIEVQRRITGADVLRILGALMALHGVPQHVRCDNGPEFVCPAVRAWLARTAAVAALYIAPGSPWENAYAESYHARLRDEVLSREQFETLAHAQAILESWRQQYNDERPHSALGYRTPEAFAAACRRHAGPGSAALRLARHDDNRFMNECCAASGT
jgi:transposase InsO family protein